MSMQMPMSVSDNSNMEMIREDDDSVQSGQPSSPTTHPDEMRKEKVVDMKMSVRRRFGIVYCESKEDKEVSSHVLKNKDT